jgi:hypothetical protein
LRLGGAIVGRIIQRGFKADLPRLKALLERNDGEASADA